MPSSSRPSRLRRLKTATALSSLAALLALSACGGSDSAGFGSGEESGTAAAGGEHGQINVQYSWIKNEEFAGEYYADDKGYYDEAGFGAVNGISGPDTGVAKLLSGKVDIAINDAASVGAAVAEEEAPLKIVGATFQKNPFTILSLKDGADIATPADLEGKKIGVQDSNANVFKAILAANGISEDEVEVVPVDFDPTPLMKGQVDGFMAYLTNEAITVELAGHEVTNLPYADNGVPYVAETFTVTDDYLAENRELVKSFLTAEIKGWSAVFTQPTDQTVEVITKHYNQAASDNAEGMEATFGKLDPEKTRMGLEESMKLISTPETEKNGLFTISEKLQQETVDSLAAAGWEVEVEDLFDTSVIDEIYAENPELKDYTK